MRKEVGLIIKQLREEKALKQAYMAFKLKITPESYANIEQGRVDVNTKKLKDIAIILGIKVSMIFSLAENLID